MTTCSTVHNDSMPHRSAVVTRCVSSAGLLNGPELTNINPSFMSRHLDVEFVVFSIIVLTGTKSRILVFVPGAGVTPAEGSVKPTAGLTFNQVLLTLTLVQFPPASYLLSHGYWKSRNMVLPRRHECAAKRRVRQAGREEWLQSALDS